MPRVRLSVYDLPSAYEDVARGVSARRYRSKNKNAMKLIVTWKKSETTLPLKFMKGCENMSNVSEFAKVVSAKRACFDQKHFLIGQGKTSISIQAPNDESLVQTCKHDFEAEDGVKTNVLFEFSSLPCTHAEEEYELHADGNVYRRCHHVRDSLRLTNKAIHINSQHFHIVTTTNPNSPNAKVIASYNITDRRVFFDDDLVQTTVNTMNDLKKDETTHGAIQTLPVVRWSRRLEELVSEDFDECIQRKPGNTKLLQKHNLTWIYVAHDFEAYPDFWTSYLKYVVDALLRKRYQENAQSDTTNCPIVYFLRKLMRLHQNMLIKNVYLSPYGSPVDLKEFIVSLSSLPGEELQSTRFLRLLDLAKNVLFYARGLSIAFAFIAGTDFNVHNAATAFNSSSYEKKL
ncbi:unnamed protein product [Soboliphyme baturini]|uniref:Inositol-pentakisphosphate 2-kinase n=1 Tax=Soboliphyme baturini TaxID=241478 RepID=A0A183IQH6_9BILA|nr:unnamed protein product [Soboliphyme baturini]